MHIDVYPFHIHDVSGWIWIIYIFLNISMNRSPYPLHVDLVIHKDIYIYRYIYIDIRV